MAFLWSSGYNGWTRYYGRLVGTLCCREVTKPAGTYIAEFNTYAGQLQLPYQGNGQSQIPVGRPPRILHGAVWYHYPTSANDIPESLSIDEYNMANHFKIPWSSGIVNLTEADWTNGGGKLNFKFNKPPDSVNLNGTSCYCGFFTPYNTSDPNASTNFGHAVDSEGVAIFNYTTSISTSSRNAALIIEPNSLKPVPPITAPTIYITDYSKITRYNGQAYFKWSSSSGSESTTYQKINGVDVSVNSGDNIGEITFTPESYNVTQSSSYDVTAYRKNAYNGNTIVSDTKTLYTYTNPTLGNISSNMYTLNADKSPTFSWSTNTPKWPSDEAHIEVLTINGNSVKEIDDHREENKTSAKVSNVGQYVNFDPSQTNGQTVEVKIRKTHKNDSNVPAVEKTTNITIRRIPTSKVTILSYKLVSTDPSKNGKILAENEVVDKDTSTSITVSFSYPSSDSSGIVHGYKVEVLTTSGQSLYTTDVTTNSVSIPLNQLAQYSSSNKIRITPYYKHSKTDYNKTYDNEKYYGPIQEKGFPSVITKLSKPVINYPKNNSTWINKNYRILFTLPKDGDYSQYPSSIKNNYVYRDVQVKIIATLNNTTTTKIYGYQANTNVEKNENIFSLTSLTHTAKIAINPSLSSSYPNGSSYTISVRVRKNYGYSDTQSEDSWSDWSDTVKVSVSTMTHSVNEGDLIMASHFNKLNTLANRIKGTYKDDSKPVLTPSVNRGDLILADQYDLAYSDIKDVYNFVNSWGTYANSKKKVKFYEGGTLPDFKSTVGEYVTDLENDTKPKGRNYVTLLVNLANKYLNNK